jgi:hypothetical protein
MNTKIAWTLFRALEIYLLLWWAVKYYQGRVWADPEATMISLFTSAVVTLAEILLEQRAQRQKQQSIEATLEERRREIDEFEARFHKERDSLK